MTLFAKFLGWYVAAAAHGDVVGEELEGDEFEDGEQELVRLGM